jgi:hypothetical protein
MPAARSSFSFDTELARALEEQRLGRPLAQFAEQLRAAARAPVRMTDPSPTQPAARAMRLPPETGQRPLGPFRIIREHPDHFVIENSNGTFRVFKQGLSPGFIERIRAEGSDPESTAGQAPPAVSSHRLLAELRDHFVLRAGTSVVRVPKALLTAAQMAQIRSLPWDSVQHFDRGAEVQPDAGTASAGVSPSPDAGTLSQQLPATEISADMPDASTGTGDAGTDTSDAGTDTSDAGTDTSDAGTDTSDAGTSPAATPGATPTQSPDAGTPDKAPLIDGQAHPGRRTYRLKLDESKVGNPYQFVNKKRETQCVEFVQQAAGAPGTPDWLAGQKVWGAPAGSIPRGTAIATFDEATGRYPTVKGVSGVKHAAIYLYQDKAGIHVLDQWLGQDHVKERVIRPNPGTDKRSNDANTFYVIETDPRAATAPTGSKAATAPTGSKAATAPRPEYLRPPGPWLDPSDSVGWNGASYGKRKPSH